MSKRVSEDLREVILRLYSERVRPGVSDRAVSRDVASLTGVSRSTVLRYAKPGYVGAAASTAPRRLEGDA